MSIGGSNVTRMVSGDNVTADLIMTNMTLDKTSTDGFTTDETITITATGTNTTNGEFTWVQTSGEPVVMFGSTTSVLSFEPKVADDYVFKLTYSRDNYEIVSSANVTIIKVAQEEALTNLLTTASNINTTDGFNEAFDVFATYSTNVSDSADEDNQLVSTAENLITALVSNSANANFVPTEAQIDDLIDVIDNSVKTTSATLTETGFDSVINVLSSLDDITSGITESQAQKGF